MALIGHLNMLKIILTTTGRHPYRYAAINSEDSNSNLDSNPVNDTAAATKIKYWFCGCGLHHCVLNILLKTENALPVKKWDTKQKYIYPNKTRKLQLLLTVEINA